MMLPRETLAEEWDEADMPAYPAARYGSVHAGGIEPACADAIAERLMAAENPVAFTAYLGRKPQAFDLLDQLARACGIRVVEFNSIDLNIRHDSPCYAGIDPLPLLEQANLGLLLDTHVPFIPQSKRADAIQWIQIDIDPLKSDFPMWGFPTDMRVQGDSPVILRQVLASVEARADQAYRNRVAARITGWREARERAATRQAAASNNNKGVAGALNPAFVFATLGRKLSPDDVVLNEAIRNGPILQEHLPQTRPASYVGLAGGGLGFSGGMALGLKLAQPNRRIVQVIGDGGFHFSSPDSV
jgi:acetolactate synthase-1/2/3 large subunit